MNWTNLYLSFGGKIKRKPFLIGLVPILLLVGLLYLYGKYVFGALPVWADWLIIGLIALECLYFLGALSAKRMHDYGRGTGYLWFLYAPLIVAALFLLQQKFVSISSNEVMVVVYTILIVLAMVTFFWMLLEMMFRRSSEDVDDAASSRADADQSGLS